MIKNIVISVTLILCCYSCNNCNTPEKPNSVSVNAVWKGGCDGGHWINLKDKSGEFFRIEVYNDSNGELLLDADYKLLCADGNVPISTINWKEKIGYYNMSVNSRNYEISIIGDHACKLETQTIYGGADKI